MVYDVDVGPVGPSCFTHTQKRYEKQHIFA